MKKRWILGALMLIVLLLTACEGREAQAGQSDASALPEVASQPSAADTGEAPDMLPGLEISALREAMPEADYAAFADYLPVLRREQTFRWVAGPYDGYPDDDWEPFDADMADVHDYIWREYEKEAPATLTLDRLAVQDLDGDGTVELVLLFQDRSSLLYLILHQEADTVYGTDIFHRGFCGLQKNGVYYASGGAAAGTYCQLSFQNDRFEQRELGLRDGNHFEIAGEAVPGAAFDDWRYETLLVGSASWYAPDGTVLETDLLPGLDIPGLKASMPEADYAAFADYLPVLRGEQTFRWVAGPYDGYPDDDWEPFDADMAAVRDRFWSGFSMDGKDLPETLTLDRLAVQDLDGDGTAELVLLFQDGAYNYLVLRREGETVCGTSLYVRWFEGLQTNGVYIGAGGAGYSTYYRMSFRNGQFKAQELGEKIDDANICYRELDGREVTEAEFDAWLAENMTGGVTWYAPDGTAFQDAM